MIFPEMKIKMTGFEMSKLTIVENITMTICGMPKFMAPECLQFIRGVKPEPFKTDIYSLAATACWMVLKNIPDVEDIIYK